MYAKSSKFFAITFQLVGDTVISKSVSDFTSIVSSNIAGMVANAEGHLKVGAPSVGHLYLQISGVTIKVHRSAISVPSDAGWRGVLDVADQIYGAISRTLILQSAHSWLCWDAIKHNTPQCNRRSSGLLEKPSL